MMMTALTPAMAEGTKDMMERDGVEVEAKTVALKGLLRTGWLMTTLLSCTRNIPMEYAPEIVGTYVKECSQPDNEET